MSCIAISSARPLDAGAVGNVLTVSIRLMRWLPPLHTAAEDIRYAGEMIDAGWVRVARQEGNVIGFIARQETDVHALYLLPDAQGMGVGTALLDDAKSVSDRLSLWTYEANQRAMRFYRQRGFLEVDRTEGSGNEAGLPDIRFAWTRGKC
ncbi:MAG: GNAT family N-acetyltransferase [Pseudomonadota bacterium]